MIMTEAEARDRLRRSPLNAFQERFKLNAHLTETAPGAGQVPLGPDSNLELMLRASLDNAKETETPEAQT